MSEAIQQYHLTAVFGLGRSGLSTLRALQARGQAAIGWDDAETARQKAQAMGYEISDPRLRLADISRLIVSPGVPLYGPHCPDLVKQAQLHNIAIEGDMDILADDLSAVSTPLNASPTSAQPIIVAVTGTNGKSTTTALIAHLCAEAGRAVVLAGNIGLPVLDTDYAKADILVLELSSYQIELMHRLRIDIGVLTNITPDHLDRHGSMANYVAAKKKLFSHVKPQGLALLGVDGPEERMLADDLSRSPAGALRVDRLSVQDRATNGRGSPDDDILENPIDTLSGDSLHYTGGCLHSASGHEFDLTAIDTLRGRHNAQNAGLAIRVGLDLGLDAADIQRGLASFKGLAHRLQPIARSGQVTFVNDSKATNVEATIHALRAYDHIHWIAGGQPKANGLVGVESALSQISHAYLIGEAAAEFSGFLSRHGVTHQIDETLERAVQAAAIGAAGEAEPATVLLSPACASFDQFANFEARGDAFCALVHEMIAKSGQPEAIS